jgi:hypothetical protein
MKLWKRSKPKAVPFSDPAYWFPLVGTLVEYGREIDSDGNRYRLSYSLETIKAAAHIASSQIDESSAITAFVSTLKAGVIPIYEGKRKTT